MFARICLMIDVCLFGLTLPLSHLRENHHLPHSIRCTTAELDAHHPRPRCLCQPSSTIFLSFLSCSRCNGRQGPCAVDAFRHEGRHRQMHRGARLHCREPGRPDVPQGGRLSTRHLKVEFVNRAFYVLSRTTRSQCYCSCRPSRVGTLCVLIRLCSHLHLIRHTGLL